MSRDNNNCKKDIENEAIKQGIMPEDIKIDTKRILARPIVTVDYDLYAQYLDDADISEDDKHELIQMIWNIIFEFASLGFDIHPLQQIEGACGQKSKTGEFRPQEPGDAVELEHQFSNQ